MAWRSSRRCLSVNIVRAVAVEASYRPAEISLTAPTASKQSPNPVKVLFSDLSSQRDRVVRSRGCQDDRNRGNDKRGHDGGDHKPRTDRAWSASRVPGGSEKLFGVNPQIVV